MKTIRSVKGMHDIMPDDMQGWHFVENTYRSLVDRFGYLEIRTPILEPLELFIRGIGETTDIVEKEMYAFEDKGGNHLALRPEGTASAIRAYIQHNIQAQKPVAKWYYLGPMFRRERPAKGRFRQFYQAGAEIIGTDAAAADAEIIDMAVQFIKSLGIEGVTVQLNTLGDESTRPLFRSALVDYFTELENQLCSDCQRRLKTNPLRILDCKKSRCGEVAAEAPSILDFLSDEAASHFDTLRGLLDRYGTNYKVFPSMVRGLDYYTRTIFEVQVDSTALGAQAAILGGGRYDNLVKQLGGRDAPAIGFSFGIERLLMIIAKNIAQAKDPLFFVAGVGQGGLERAFDLARRLRKTGHRVEISYTESSLRSQLKRADRFGAAITLIAGEDEAQRSAITWRDMKNGQQEEVLLDDIDKRIEAEL
ncbi:MAG: histidine--tRNA ligase [Proteobacteria bacterium]|nr:histidine--tRNA ligase [Pseudomonadota bacterium]